MMSNDRSLSVRSTAARSTPHAEMEPPPTIEMLRRDVAERRREYREAMANDSDGCCALARWHGRWCARDGGVAELGELNAVAEAFLKIQRAKLAYDEALDQLRAAEDARARARSERTQRSATLAAWTAVLVTVASVLVALRH
jgi:hypothetical protein